MQAMYYGVLAQLGEHLPYKQRVIGSSPIGPIYSAKNGFYMPMWLNSLRSTNEVSWSHAEQLICNQQVIGSSPIIGLSV